MQFLRFPLRIALSHLRSRRSEKGVSVITMVSILGVTVGVTALIMVLAVMEGFELDLRDKILGANAHIIVHNYSFFDEYQGTLDTINGVQGVKEASPIIYSEMMIRSSSSNAGILIKGIDPKSSAEDVVDNIIMGSEGEVTTFAQRRSVLENIRTPPSSMYTTKDTNSVPGIILGRELSSMLGVVVGSKVHIINPIGGGVGPMGVPTPQVKSFQVAGIFHSGMYEYDTKWCYVSLTDLRDFLKLSDEINSIEVRVDDIDEAEDLAAQVRDVLPGNFQVRHWKEMNSELFKALKMEKIVMGLILSLIVMVASLNIIGTLILVVVTRRREISIFRAMGTTSMQICSIFMLEGLIIGLVGTIVGTALGLAGCYGLREYEWPLDTDVYFLDTLPVVVDYGTVGIVGGTSILICFLATIYPAYLAASMDPVEGLRYD